MSGATSGHRGVGIGSRHPYVCHECVHVSVIHVNRVTAALCPHWVLSCTGRWAVSVAWRAVAEPSCPCVCDTSLRFIPSYGEAQRGLGVALSSRGSVAVGRGPSYS